MSNSQWNNNKNPPDQPAGHGLSALLGASTLMFACRVLGAGLAFLTQLLLARWMGAHQLGIYVYAFSWLIILSTIIGIGYESASFRVIGQALSNRRYDLIRGFLRRGRQILLIIGLSAIVILGSVLFYFDGVVDAEYRNTLIIALITVPVYLIAVFHEAVSHAFSWFAMMILPNSVIRPLILLIIVTIVWSFDGNLDSERVMIYQLIAMISVVLGHYLIFRKKLAAILGDARPVYLTRTWVRIGLPQLVPVLYISFLPEISVVMVGFFLPPDQVAVFSIAFRVAMLISFMIFAVDSIFRPKAALLYAEGNMAQLQKLTSQSTQLMFWPGLACVVLFLVFGRYILGFFGDEFVAGYEVFALLSVCQLIIVFTGPVASLLNVTGHQDYSLMVFAIALFILMILDAVLTPILGMNGAAIGVILVTAIWNGWMLTLVKRHLKIHPTVLSFGYQYK